MNSSAKPAHKENPVVNILLNVVLPVVILNKVSPKSPLLALLVAMSLPLGYGIYSFIKNKKVNYISLLGLLNTLFTGGFALLRLEGIWFAVKEAAFPLLIGLFVFGSSFKGTPFLKFILFDSGALNTEDVQNAIKEQRKESQFLSLLKRFTLFFSSTFFLSAFLNFVLAIRIFTPISESLAENVQNEILNQQIADMTWQGYVVIFIPSISILFIVLFFFFRKLTQLTGIPFEKLVKET
jgi:hypothetical protein